MNTFRQTARRSAGVVAVIALAGGCAVGPNFVRPAPPEADRYTGAPPIATTVAADGRAQTFTPGGRIAEDWWRLFGSAGLDNAVRKAISNNATLEAAEASLRQSQDNMRAGYGVFYPQAQAGLSATRQLSAPSQQGLGTGGKIFNVFTASGAVSYTFDVFGGKRRAVEALRAQADSQRYETKAAYLALSGNVVNTCIARAGYAEQIRATKQLIDLETQQLRLAEAQFHSGMAPYASVLALRGQLSSYQASLAPLEQGASQAAHLLATLEGVTPSQAGLPEIDLSALTVPANLPLSLPSELVNQRPDILSAEALMHAASANIGAATAAMLPSFSLSGTYGGASSTLANLSAVSKFWSVGPTVTTPVFQGNSLWYTRRASIDAYQQSRAVYRQTVLGAFQQVADSLKGLEHHAEALQAQVEGKRAAGEALALTRANYQAGLVAYLDVLSSDAQFQTATIAYAQAVTQRHQDTVALFVALGGGWWNVERAGGKGGAW